MNIWNRIFGKKEKEPSSGEPSGKKKLPTLEQFLSLNPRERMGVIMHLGDSGKSENFPFVKHAILMDADPDVKFAALKRIHHFKDHPETIQTLMEFKDKGGENYEPYFSMARSRLGLISLEEFNEIIHRK